MFKVIYFSPTSLRRRDPLSNSAPDYVVPEGRLTDWRAARIRCCVPLSVWTCHACTDRVLFCHCLVLAIWIKRKSTDTKTLSLVSVGRLKVKKTESYLFFISVCKSQILLIFARQLVIVKKSQIKRYQCVSVRHTIIL